jgi:hypothetical protein
VCIGTIEFLPSQKRTMRAPVASASNEDVREKNQVKRSSILVSALPSEQTLHAPARFNYQSILALASAMIELTR